MSDQRKSSRCPVLASRMRCELRLGSLVLPAILFDESNNGFGVLVGGLPSISAKQRVQLHNDCGWFDGCIVYAAEVVPTKTIPVKKTKLADGVSNSVRPEKDLFERDSTVIRKELFNGDSMTVKNELFKGDITIVPLDHDGCEEQVENGSVLEYIVDGGATKRIEDGDAGEYITTADIKDFTASMGGPWFRLGIRCLDKIAQTSEPTASLLIESDSVNPTQWIKSMLSSVFHH